MKTSAMGTVYLITAASKSRLRSAPKLGDDAEILVRQLYRGSRGVLFEMADLARARDRQHHRRALQQPGETQLASTRPVLLHHRGKYRIGGTGGAAVDRPPRDEGDLASLAIAEHCLARPVRDRIFVLDADHRK